MAEYIDREKVLSYSKSYNTDGWDSYTPLVVDVEDIEEIPPADVVERSEYEKIKFERDISIQQILNLGISISKAIEEMEDLANHKIRPISFDQAVAVDMCLEILKRNIGD